MEPEIEPQSETIYKNTPTRLEYYFFNEELNPIHKCRVEYKNEPKIISYPYSYSEAQGLNIKKVSEVEFRGWSNYEDLPKLLKPSSNISLGHKIIAPLMRVLYSKYPNLKKLVVIKEGGSTRFSESVITFSFADLEKICKAITKEIRTFEVRRKTAVLNSLSEISSNFTSRQTSLARGDLQHFLSFYAGDFKLSAADADAVLGLITHIPLGNVTVTENYIETKNKINVAYLDKIIRSFEALLDVKSDNEKAWQDFFDENAWIIASVFPYQVVIRGKEAFVGGKTIENSEGRVVDFLFQNEFRDNYALLEVKTHNKKILSNTAYREPDAFSLHAECSGGIAQCLDQKNTFLTDMGQKYPSLDPKCVLIIGQKSKLTENQRRSFELMRSNQKNVDLITFDEVLEKIYGLRSILQG